MTAAAQLTRPVSAPITTAMADVQTPTAKAKPSWTAFPKGVVDGGEIVQLAIKPSIWRPVVESAPWIVTAVLLCVTLILLNVPFPGWSLALTTQTILFIGSLRLGMAIIGWVPTWYVLTNRRVICIHGIRSPGITSSPLLEVRNTYLRASSFEQLAGLGTIIFALNDSDRDPIVWSYIGNAEEVHARVRRAIENAIDQHGIS